MLIYRRIKTGWTDQQENKSTTHCDICGARLWANPDGEPYCNGNWSECTDKNLTDKIQENDELQMRRQHEIEPNI